MNSCTSPSRIIRRVIPHNIYLTNKDGTTDSHGDGDDWKIHTRKFDSPNANVFSGEDIAPQETSQRRAERRAKGTVVDPESHAIHCSPEFPIGDGEPIDAMDLLPSLYYAGEKDGGANVRACKLLIWVKD